MSIQPYFKRPSQLAPLRFGDQAVKAYFEASPTRPSGVASRILLATRRCGVGMFKLSGVAREASTLLLSRRVGRRHHAEVRIQVRRDCNICTLQTRNRAPARRLRMGFAQTRNIKHDELGPSQYYGAGARRFRLMLTTQISRSLGERIRCGLWAIQSGGRDESSARTRRTHLVDAAWVGDRESVHCDAGSRSNNNPALQPTF